MIAGAVGWYFYQNQLSKTIDLDLSFTVEKGQSFNSVLNYLQQEVRTSAPIGKVYLKINGQESALKPGEYQLSSNMTYKSVIKLLTEGQIIEHRVTIPEGFNVFEIAKLLKKKEIILKEEDFLNLALNHCKDFLNKEDCATKSLEGFLFPETYQFQKKTEPAIILKTLVDHHLEQKKDLIKKYQLPATLKSWSELVTLASVIEKETGAPWERPLISSVFHNRLGMGMRLQSDPTTIYGRWVVDKKRLFNIKKKHLLEKTPYNTYTVRRLPIGPIANPGQKALEAALSPEESRFLYFVSKNDGTHKFSKTYKEHQKAVRDFQLSSGARKGKSWRDLK
jgi:UPF0755 protein